MTTEFEYLKTWILDYLDQPRPLLNDFPICPFAKKAMLDEKILFMKSIDYITDIEFLFSNWNKKYDVAIIIVPSTISAVDLVRSMKNLNKKWVELGFCCLEDHIDIHEDFHGLTFNNGKYNIILCQETNKLNEAAAYLKEKGYYKNWTKEMYEDVVLWRSLS